MALPAEKLEEPSPREEQGLPPKIEDPAVLARVAELMRSGPARSKAS
jgi:hypothetical protein